MDQLFFLNSHVQKNVKLKMYYRGNIRNATEEEHLYIFFLTFLILVTFI